MPIGNARSACFASKLTHGSPRVAGHGLAGLKDGQFLGVLADAERRGGPLAVGVVGVVGGGGGGGGCDSVAADGHGQQVKNRHRPRVQVHCGTRPTWPDLGG